VSCDLPQGLILGPDFYIDFTIPILIASKHNVIPSFYADESQTYIHFNPKLCPELKCCANIKDWMNVILLKLYQEKTELSLIGSKHQKQNMININLINICRHDIKPCNWIM
jgi:hypothetical protein